MRVFLSTVALFVAACGSEESANSTADAGGSNGTGAGGAGATGGGGGAGGGGATGGRGGDAPTTCADQIPHLDAFFQRLRTTDSLLQAHASGLKYAGFYSAVGLQNPPGTTGDVLGLSDCPMGALPPTACEGGACREVVCTGQGAGWSMTYSLETAPYVAGSFTIGSAETTTSWADGAGELGFTIDSVATDLQDDDWSMQATGTIGTLMTTVTATFPALFSEGPAVFSGTIGNPSSGAVTVAGVDIAVVNVDELEATGDCP